MPERLITEAKMCLLRCEASVGVFSLNEQLFLIGAHDGRDFLYGLPTRGGPALELLIRVA